MSYVQFEEKSMAKRGDPSVLRLVVIFLRSYAEMTQEQFGRESRVAQPEVSRYELGHVAPPEEALRRMATVARIDWSLVVHLRRFYTSLLAAASRGGAAPAGEALDLSMLEPVLLAVAPYLIEPYAAEPDPPSRAEEPYGQPSGKSGPN